MNVLDFKKDVGLWHGILTVSVCPVCGVCGRQLSPSHLTPGPSGEPSLHTRTPEPGLWGLFPESGLEVDVGAGGGSPGPALCCGHGEELDGSFLLFLSSTSVEHSETQFSSCCPGKAPLGFSLMCSVCSREIVSPSTEEHLIIGAGVRCSVGTNALAPLSDAGEAPEPQPL